MDKLLTVNEVAQLIGITTFGIYGLVHKKQIPALKISRRCLRFRSQDIEKWLASKSQDVRAMTEPKLASRQGRHRQKHRLPDSRIDSLVEKTKRDVLG